MSLANHQNTIFGFIRPGNDAHTLGVSSISNILEDCGYKTVIANAAIANAVTIADKLSGISLLTQWIISNNISYLGFSYRLDPSDAQRMFGVVFHQLKEQKLMYEDGGTIRKIMFAGLPDACILIDNEYSEEILTFSGDETQYETLTKIGIPKNRIPENLTQGSRYDSIRWKFATELIHKGKYNFLLPSGKPSYSNYGTKNDTLKERLKNQKQGVPLIRVHVGPYQSNYTEAKKEFHSWCKVLSESGFLDILSIGSSQLSQSDFEEEWGDKPNGGGVPINSKQDLHNIWLHSRPLLVRTYAGTKNIPYLAGVYEETINAAWHALSFWWFNKIDGRGPYDVYTNLQQHFDTLKVIAKAGKPIEPNTPHHFAFRGGDDISYVLSGYLAAIAAKKSGVQQMVLQVMLNTPKYTWGIKDLAKTRALLRLVRTLEDPTFQVFLQPRAGLDYFSPDIEKAKIQLASVTAMMDDIEPNNINSPEVIHVVSYSEASKLATPEIINESIQITQQALLDYRIQKRNGHIEDYARSSNEIKERTNDLVESTIKIREILENHIPNLYSPEGFYKIFKIGVFPVPYLWEGREEFKEAVKWKTKLVDGGVEATDEKGECIRPTLRILNLFNNKETHAK